MKHASYDNRYFNGPDKLASISHHVDMPDQNIYTKELQPLYVDGKGKLSATKIKKNELFNGGL